MKKNLLFIFALLMISVVNGQVISITPNSGNYGQTLVTTITLASGVMNTSTTPVGSIYLRKGTSIIYANAVSNYPPSPPFSDSVTATFTIPAVAQPGIYDVHVQVWSFSPWPQYYDHILSGGFSFGNIAGTIAGKVYFDNNQNGIKDVNDSGYGNIRVLLNPAGFSTFTDYYGNYSIDVDTGNYDVSILTTAPQIQTSTPLTYSVTIPPDSSGNDFGAYLPPPPPGQQNFWLYTHAMRCNYFGWSAWHIYNMTSAIEYGNVTVIYSPNLGFNMANIIPDSIYSDTLRWDYTLNPHGYLTSGVVYNNPPAGDTVWYVVIDSVFDINGVLQQVYSDSYTFVVSCSVDPNDKSVTPEGDDLLGLNLINTDFTYTIRFQNTGTDTAFNVVILDTIDSDLDLNTLEILSSSHPVNPLLDANRLIRFKFDNILLPDSNVDEPGSHGYIIYRIKPLSNVPDSTQIKNRAYIYFDFNAAVLTNQTLNTLVAQFPVAVTEVEAMPESFVYPNPVSNVSTLFLPAKGSFDLRVFDITGKEMFVKNINNSFKIMKNNFAPGIYYYHLQNKEGVSFTGKFVIQ